MYEEVMSEPARCVNMAAAIDYNGTGYGNADTAVFFARGSR